DVTRVGDIEVAGGVHGDPHGAAQLGAGGRAVVAAETLRPISRRGGDHPVRDLADAVVDRVGDVQVAGRVDGDPGGKVQLGAGGRAVVAQTRRAPARHGGDHPARYLADEAVTEEGGIGEVKVAVRIHGDALWTPQLGAGGRASVEKARRGPARHGGNHPARYLADADVSR